MKVLSLETAALFPGCELTVTLRSPEALAAISDEWVIVVPTPPEVAPRGATKARVITRVVDRSTTRVLLKGVERTRPDGGVLPDLSRVASDDVAAIRSLTDSMSRRKPRVAPTDDPTLWLWRTAGAIVWRIADALALLESQDGSSRAKRVLGMLQNELDAAMIERAVLHPDT